MQWLLNGKTLSFEQPVIIGILNITPDSFSDGGKHFNKGRIDMKKAISKAKKMINEGAAIIDVGGESSRPGSDPVSEEEELRRVLPIIIEIAKLDTIISIDTTKPAVADTCISAGAHIINDITGFTNQKMINVAKKYAKQGIGCIVMHMKGNPKTMQQNVQYDDVVEEVYQFLKKQVIMLKKQGIKHIMIDPGIGFGKEVRHNLLLLKNINRFKPLNRPILIGASKKSFIGKIINTDIDDRLSGSIAVNIAAIHAGADAIRVHDVKEHAQAMKMFQALQNAGKDEE